MPPARALTAVLFLMTAIGCGPSGGPVAITDVRDRGPVHPPTAFGVTSRERFEGDPHGSVAHGSPRGGEFPAPWTWTAPEGWVALPTDAMRVAGFRIGTAGRAECTFSVFSGDVGGLRANIDRWRGQLGLEPLEPTAALPDLARIPFLGRPAPVVELSGTYSGMAEGVPVAGARLLGAIQGLPTRTAFVKLVGPAAEVEAARGAFESFVASIREAGGAGPAAPGAPLAWTVPDGWTTRPPRSMRVVTLGPPGAEGTECYVTILAGTAGGVAENVNRWREQMGQPPLDAEAVAALPRIDVLGRPAPLVEVSGDFTGMDGSRVTDAALLGVVRLRQRDTLFVKMTGPADVVRGERVRFEAFCRSLRERR